MFSITSSLAKERRWYIKKAILLNAFLINIFAVINIELRQHTFNGKEMKFVCICRREVKGVRGIYIERKKEVLTPAGSAHHKWRETFAQLLLLTHSRNCMKPEQLRCKYTCLAQRLVLAHPPLVWKQKKKKKRTGKRFLFTLKKQICAEALQLYWYKTKPMYKTTATTTLLMSSPQMRFLS